MTLLHIFEATAADRGKRLDQFLHERLPGYSRSRLQEWVKAGRVRVDSTPQKPSFSLHGAEKVEVEPADLPALRAFAENIPLQVLYVDADLIAVNKPAGIVVHAGAGRHSGTLVNALLHHFHTLSTVGGDERPGIVHRLDRDTSGVLIVARTDAAHRALAAQFAGRHVEKVYLALVEGNVSHDHGRIDSPIARDPVRRTRMTSRLQHGRAAVTGYKVLERFSKYTFVEVRIGTGRTHQIRVHMSSMRHPVAGDTLYGAAAAPYGRFFLHAKSIQFTSPSSGNPLRVEAPLPDDLERWLAHVRKQQPSAAV